MSTPHLARRLLGSANSGLLAGLVAIAGATIGRSADAPPGTVPTLPATAPVPPAKTSTAAAPSGLSPEDLVRAQELESRINANPEDLGARRELLHAYFLWQYKSADIRASRQKNILWLIEHHPEAATPGPEVSLHARIDGAAYDQGRTLWLQQVQNHPRDLVILDHAADYLLLEDRPATEGLLKKAEAVEPANPHWPERLAQLYALASGPNGATDPATAGQALAEMKKAQADAKDDGVKYLERLAKMAFSAGEIDQARGYAEELLRRAPEVQGQWNYGNAVHQGNVILGRVAVHDGNLEAAKKYLLAAGDTPGSPQLNSFGPNMSLAKDLAEKGEKETVLAYFTRCRTFWQRGRDKLDAWSITVAAGRIPDFGANLVY